MHIPKQAEALCWFSSVLVILAWCDIFVPNTLYKSVLILREAKQLRKLRKKNVVKSLAKSDMRGTDAKLSNWQHQIHIFHALEKHSWALNDIIPAVHNNWSLKNYLNDMPTEYALVSLATALGVRCSLHMYNYDTVKILEDKDASLHIMSEYFDEEPTTIQHIASHDVTLMELTVQINTEDMHSILLVKKEEWFILDAHFGYPLCLQCMYPNKFIHQLQCLFHSFDISFPFGHATRCCPYKKLSGILLVEQHFC